MRGNRKVWSSRKTPPMEAEIHPKVITIVRSHVCLCVHFLHSRQTRWYTQFQFPSYIHHKLTWHAPLLEFSVDEPIPAFCETSRSHADYSLLACGGMQSGTAIPISGVPRGGGVGVFKPPTPPKFRKYRWSPRSHEQEELASRFPFAVHCFLIRL